MDTFYAMVGGAAVAAGGLGGASELHIAGIVKWRHRVLNSEATTTMIMNLLQDTS